jgi:putative transposase
MCKVLKVSKSGYYRMRNYLPSKRDGENRMLLAEIQRIHKESKASYGSPRMTEELRKRGFNVSRPHVARLMKENGIKAVRAKKFVVTTNSKHKYPVAENKLNRNFTAENSGQVWVSDITYIRTGKGWLYLTIVLDVFDRKVVGWTLSSDMRAENTSVAAWRMAVKNRPPSSALIFHSDRGVQYACHVFVNLLASYKCVERSMSRKDLILRGENKVFGYWDNALAESFFETIKTELVYRTRYFDREQAAISIFEWIETWYNRKRRHSALGNLTINEFEQLMKFRNVA